MIQIEILLHLGHRDEDTWSRGTADTQLQTCDIKSKVHFLNPEILQSFVITEKQTKEMPVTISYLSNLNTVRPRSTSESASLSVPQTFYNLIFP